MYQFLPSQKRPLVVLVAAACLSLSFAAQASVVSNLQASTSASMDGATPDTNVNGPSDSAVYSYSSQYGISSASSDAFGVNYAGGGTRYAASANGTGIFTSQAMFTKTLTITNTESYAQTYDLSYFIYGGSVSVGSWWGSTQIGDTGSASLSFRIFDADDSKNSLLSRTANLTLQSDSTIDYVFTGFTALYSPGSNYLSTLSESDSISLGVLAAGASKTISYELIAEATGDYHFVQNNECCYECSSGEIATLAVSYECGYGAGSSNAFLGDPDGVNGTGDPGVMNVTGQRLNTVPLPGTLALMGIGLAGVGEARRKRSS